MQGILIRCEESSTKTIDGKYNYHDIGFDKAYIEAIFY